MSDAAVTRIKRFDKWVWLNASYEISCYEMNTTPLMVARHKLWGVGKLDQLISFSEIFVRNFLLIYYRTVECLMGFADEKLIRHIPFKLDSFWFCADFSWLILLSSILWYLTFVRISKNCFRVKSSDFS